jgi:alanyl aminopeptidase
VLDLIAALAADKDRHVLEALFPALADLRDQGLVAEEQMARYQSFVRDLFGKRAHAFGFAEKKHEADDVRILRPQLLRIAGDQGGDLELRDEAQKVALRWLANHAAVSPELAAAALHLSAIDGDAQLYDKLHQAAKAEKDRPSRLRILEAMGHFRDPELVQQGLQIFLSDEFDPRESSTLFRGPSAYFGTREAALRFVEKNFDAIVQRLPRGIGDYGALLPSIADGFCDEAHAAEAEQFFRPLMKSHPGGDRRLAQTLEDVRQCTAFRENQAKAVASYFGKPQAASR